MPTIDRAGRRRPRGAASGPVRTGAVPADALEGRFPALDLPLVPPVEPLEATSTDTLPANAGWQFEPKWDGFRSVTFRSGDEVVLQSKSGQRLDRYFPDLVAALRQLRQPRFVLDGEIVIETGGVLSFDDLLMRIHPAEGRVRRLAAETPASLLVFDILFDDETPPLMARPLRERRERLERFFARAGVSPRVLLSPASAERSVAERWMQTLVGHGLDGVVAKRLEAPYVPGDRHSMLKVKPARTADCVVGGFRYDERHAGVASLLLGLYDAEGLLDHVGFAASFTADDRRALREIVEPMRGGPGFTGRAPGGPSRWSRKTSNEWERLRPSLVCEVAFDHFSGGRFRHGVGFLRWRPDKRAHQCTFDQVRPAQWSGGLAALLEATH